MARDNSVTERDMGWTRIRRDIIAVDGKGVGVGILADTPPNDEGDDMIDIAISNEFGTDRIPARPFVRGGFDQHVVDLNQLKARLWDLVLAGRLTVDRALVLLGETHQNQVQKFLTDLRSPPNSARTIANKRGSTNPLIDTGRLRASIRWERD